MHRCIRHLPFLFSLVSIAGLLLDYTGNYLAGFLYGGILQGMCGVLGLLYHVMWTRCFKDPRWPPPLPPRCSRSRAEANQLPDGA